MTKAPDNSIINCLDENYAFFEKMRLKFLEKWNKPTMSCDSGLSNYSIKATLGSGSFGKVFLIKRAGSIYAAKMISKEVIVKTKQFKHLMNEKRVLNSINFPFMVYLIESCKDFDNVYFVLPFVSGGELYTYLRKMRHLTEAATRFYAGQIFLALQYLHFCGVLYRDLKPENILIEVNGYLKVIDFGFAKKVETRTMTLCGTPEYLAPEIIQSIPYGPGVDWWSFGVLVYELVAGSTPFSPYRNDLLKMYKKICDSVYNIPSNFSRPLSVLIKNLLQVDSTKRFGSMHNGLNDIKNAEWFDGMNWTALLKQELPAPYIPKVEGECDVSNFSSMPLSKIKIFNNVNRHETVFEDF